MEKMDEKETARLFCIVFLAWLICFLALAGCGKNKISGTEVETGESLLELTIEISGTIQLYRPYYDATVWQKLEDEFGEIWFY